MDMVYACDGRLVTPLSGGGIYGGLVKNKAYKQGYGTATAQLSPMVSALHGPRGNIGRTPYGA